MKSRVTAAARSAQQALGVEAPNHMKGLQVFIADIRNCPTKEQEEKRVNRELAKIRQRFTAEGDRMSGYDKKKYIWKLLYAYMLGYEIDCGHHLQAVKLCSSSKFSEKTAGYLAISLLLSDNEKMLTMVVNSIKQDMASGNDALAALALNTVANIGGSEFADNLFSDIAKMLIMPGSRLSQYIKRKCCICLLRLYRKDTDTLSPDVWRTKLAAMFKETDVGLLTSASGLVLGILEQGTFPAREWLPIMPAVVEALAQLVQGECPEHYIYYHVPCPWLQTKLLRILQFFPVEVLNSDTLGKIRNILHMVLVKPAGQRPGVQSGPAKKRGKADAERQNRSNAEHAVLFEAMNLMIHLEDRCDAQLTSMAAGLLGNFVQSPDPNIRYLGLETMARLATNAGTQEHLERYKLTILEKMHESDISIRRQALNLLYALCRPENWESIVNELLEILGQSDSLLKEELVLKIAILAEKNAPNFRWYVDVVFKMLESAPEAVGDDVWFRVVQVVTGFPDSQNEQERNQLKRHAAGKAYQSLSVTPTSHHLHDTLVKLAVYLVGEFGHLLPTNIAPKAKVEVLKHHFAKASPSTKVIIELAMLKLLNATPDQLKREVMPFIEDLRDSRDVELQQRSCEMLRLVKNEELLEEIMQPMPQYAETVQQNNPLISRLKFQNKNRAQSRAQLEAAAKSEGGLVKPGNRMPGATGASARGPANNNDSDSGSDSGSESGSDEEPPAAPGGGSGPMDLWKNLCIMPQGRFYTSPSLALEIKQEYNAALGRLTIMFTNSSRSTIRVRVNLQDCPFMRFNAKNEAPAQLAPGAQAPHYIECQCLRPFLQPAKYMLEYQEDGQVKQAPLMLPAVMTKFISPAQMDVTTFRQHFESFANPPRENQVTGQAKVQPSEWPNYLTKGFNLFMLRESTPANAFAAGTFNTGTPDPSGKPMTVPIMLRIEYDSGRGAVRLTVRTSNGEATAAISKIVETYLVSAA